LHRCFSAFQYGQDIYNAIGTRTVGNRVLSGTSGMGQALQEENALEEAVAWYQRALQLDPESARIQCNLAGALAEREKYDEALARYHLALRLDPAYAEAHSGLGGVRHEQGYHAQAEAHHREALRLKPDLATARCPRAASGIGTRNRQTAGASRSVMSESFGARAARAWQRAIQPWLRRQACRLRPRLAIWCSLRAATPARGKRRRPNGSGQQVRW
jgi:tetratricopeptide (TPR) repeat protein